MKNAIQNIIIKTFGTKLHDDNGYLLNGEVFKLN
jgi:hypothetical protein